MFTTIYDYIHFYIWECLWLSGDPMNHMTFTMIEETETFSY